VLTPQKTCHLDVEQVQGKSKKPVFELLADIEGLTARLRAVGDPLHLEAADALAATGAAAERLQERVYQLEAIASVGVALLLVCRLPPQILSCRAMTEAGPCRFRPGGNGSQIATRSGSCWRSGDCSVAKPPRKTRSICVRTGMTPADAAPAEVTTPSRSTHNGP